MAEAIVAPLPKLRPGVQVVSMGKPEFEIDISVNNSGAVSGVAVSPQHSLIAILDENKKTVHIYNTTKRSLVGEFVIDDENFSYANQMTFDRHNNIVIAPGDSAMLLRYNMNGKKLPDLPSHPGDCTSGVACSPSGDLYYSVGEGKHRIARLDRDTNQWDIIYHGKNDEDGSDNEDDEEDGDGEDDDYRTDRFVPGQMAFGPDGYLYVATETCVNVVNASDGSVVRQIGVEQHKNGKLSKVEGIFVSGDGFLFVCDQDCNVMAFNSHDGSFICDLFADSQMNVQQPWCINMDWAGYVYISDLASGVVYVF